MVRILLDTSTLVSLAWSAQLSLLSHLPIEPVLIASVHHEAVGQGLARGHADAQAIAEAVRDIELLPDPAGDSVDAKVVAAAAAVGAVAANDQVIGRRATNLAVRWVRTGDLVVLASAAGSIDVPTARRAIHALAAAGRITTPLRDAFLEDIG